MDRTLINVANAAEPLVIDGVSTPDITDVQLQVDGQPVHSVTPTADGTWSATIPAEDLAGLAQGSATLTAHYVSNAGTAPPDQTRALTKDTIAPPPPTATPAAGIFAGTQVVTLSDAERGVGIFYSNDGGDPTPESLAAVAPLVVTASQTIKAIAVDGAGNSSPVASFPFVIGNATAPGAASWAFTAGRAGRALRALNLGSRIKVTRLRAHGLRLSMAVTGDAHVVRIRVYRAGRNGRRTGAPLLSTFRVPAAAGTFRVTLRSGSLLRRMRPGRYVVEVAAGDSGSALQAPLSRLLTVTR
jgi:hypothetical protein